MRVSIIMGAYNVENTIERAIDSILKQTLGHCSQLIYTAFAGGWQFFAFSTMKEEDQVESNSNVFEYLGVISFGFTAIVISLSRFIFSFLFTSEYFDGFIVAPYLFLAPLMQMLFQVAANQFLVIKKTWPNMLILSSGAVINVFLNFCLIPILGIEGAAVATLFGYICSDIICCIVLIKMQLMKITKRFIFSLLLLSIVFIIWRCLFIDNTLVNLFVVLIYEIILICLYKKEIKILLEKVKKHL